MSGPNIIICKLKKVFSKSLALNNDDKKKNKLTNFLGIAQNSRQENDLNWKLIDCFLFDGNISLCQTELGTHKNIQNFLQTIDFYCSHSIL